MFRLLSRRRIQTQVVRRVFFAMGTEISLSLVISEPEEIEAAELAILEMKAILDRFGEQWWPWSGGQLSQFNAQLERGESASIPQDMQALFCRAWALHEATGGAFDPRVAPLVKLWGFHDFAATPEAPPDADMVRDYLHKLSLAPAYQGGDTYGPAPGIGWDFGGIGKGWIVDQVLGQLAQRTFRDVIIDAGGNLAVRGSCGRRSWRIGIRVPDSNPASPELLASLDARDEAVNTHGDDQRFFMHQGRRYGHILNPWTGEPASGLRSVTVVHADGSLAEAGGAALFVAGPQHWQALAQQLNLEQVLVVHDSGQVEATRALYKRIRRERPLPIDIV